MVHHLSLEKMLNNTLNKIELSSFHHLQIIQNHNQIIKYFLHTFFYIKLSTMQHFIKYKRS